MPGIRRIVKELKRYSVRHGDSSSEELNSDRFSAAEVVGRAALLRLLIRLFFVKPG